MLFVVLAESYMVAVKGAVEYRSGGGGWRFKNTFSNSKSFQANFSLKYFRVFERT